MKTVINRKKRRWVRAVDALVCAAYALWRTVTLERIRKPVPDLADCRRILVVDCGFLGDTVISFPAIDRLRQVYPEASLSVVVNPDYLPLWEMTPWQLDTIPYRPFWIHHRGHTSFADLRELMRTIRRLRQGHYDLAIDLRGDFRNLLFLTYLGGAAARVGYGITGGGCLLTHEVPFPDGNEVENNLALIRSLQTAPSPEETIDFVLGRPGGANPDRAPITPDSKGRETILICPTPGYRNKEWENAKWAALVDRLADTCRIILTGAAGDPNVDEIAHLASSGPVNMAGRLTLPELAALMESCRLVVGCDSGPMHLAAAVGTRSLTLFGPTEVHRWRPFRQSRVICLSLDCAPCGRYTDCPRECTCMHSISVDEVLAEIRGELADEPLPCS